MARRTPWLSAAPMLIYLVSALEIIIMVSPFAAYFYTVYTPFLHALTGSPATAWLPQFFLPHLAKTRNLLFQALAYLGPVLAGLGLLGFLACAIQLYHGKFVRKQLVTRGLYGRVRHPQYLCLSVAGAGFLLMWPRYVILITYLIMLGLYYILARHEEELVRERYGSETNAYLARVPMFNPFRSPGKAKTWRPPSRIKAWSAWLGLVAVSLGGAGILRQEAESSLYMAQWRAPNVTAISFAPRTEEQLAAIIQNVLSVPPLQERLRQAPDEQYVFQIASGGKELEHLLTDTGMKAGAIRRLEIPGSGEFVVVSRAVVHGMAVGAIDPFRGDVQREPLWLIRPAGLSGGLDAVRLEHDAFYPDFAQVLF